MLAGIRDYVHPWQLPLIFTFLAGWIIGGGYLLKWSFANQGYKKKLTLGRSIMVTFLAGSGGLFAAAVILFLFKTIVVTTGARLLPVMAAGAVVAALVYFVISYLVLYAIFELPSRQLLRMVALPLAGIITLGAIMGTAAGLPAYRTRIWGGRKTVSLADLVAIGNALVKHEMQEKKPAENLQVLVQKELLSSACLRCPFVPNTKVGYFYLPGPAQRQDADDKIVACSLRGKKAGGRAVLLHNHQSRWFSEEEFQHLLQHKANDEFAEALRKAEGG